jgi:hypothetical protein
MYDRIKANIDIHVHPFINEGWNTLEDTIERMRKNRLDVVAVESYNHSLFPYIIKEMERLYPNQELVRDSSGVVLPGGEVILNAREYNTREDFHILTVGCSFDDVGRETPIEEIIERGIEKNALVVLDHPFVDNFRTKTAGHITEEQEGWLIELCKKYSGEVVLEWNGYSIPWMRLGLRLPLTVLGHKTRYHDVNKHAKGLSERLGAEGYNVPLVADTDLHARNRWLLREMGTARFITDVKGESPGEMVSSIKRNIFSGDYQNLERFPSSLHVLLGYCIPVLFSRYFPKPRA